MKFRNVNSRRRIFSQILCLALATPWAEADPVGFETLTVQPDAFSLLALRLFEPIEVSSVVESVSGNDITDTSADFTAILDPSRKHVIFMTGGSAAYTSIDIVSYNSNTITLADATGVSATDSYQIRSLKKLSEFFNPIVNPDMNTVADFDPDSGDLILLPDGNGGYNSYFYSTFTGQEGYFNARTGQTDDPYLRNEDAILYLRQGFAYFVVSVGEVRTVPTAITLIDRFNAVGTINPITPSLDDLGFGADLMPGSATAGDLVWSQDTITGTLSAYFHSDGSLPGFTSGWRLAGAAPGMENDDQGSVVTSPGIVIRRRGPAPSRIGIAAPLISP